MAKNKKKVDEMTDAEIIKALECCIKGKCSECPLKAMFCSACVVMGFALELINRQKAEIEKLQKENNLFADLGKMYSEIKAEAIKEFAKKLRKEFPVETMGYGGIGSMYSADGIRSKINNLVKEMEGDTK